MTWLGKLVCKSHLSEFCCLSLFCLCWQAPSYRGFRGQIDKLEAHRFTANGEIGLLGEDTIEITELPIGVWTQTYKEQVLEPMLMGSEKVPATISWVLYFTTLLSEVRICFLCLSRGRTLQSAPHSTKAWINSMVTLWHEKLCFNRVISVSVGGVKIVNSQYREW